MNPMTLRRACLMTTVLLGSSVSMAQETPPILKLTGDWQIQVTVPDGAGKERTATLDVPPPEHFTVVAEKYDRLPLFDPKAPGYKKGAKLQGVVSSECTSKGLLDPTSLQVRAGPTPDAKRFEPGKDYTADLEWGTFGRLLKGRIGENQPVYVDYRHDLLRLDSIVLTADGRIELRAGKPHAATPLPPEVAAGERRLANVWVPGRIDKLAPQHLFPILETAYPEPPKSSPSPAERLLSKTVRKLREGGPVRILAWGDSVTDGGYLPESEHWQSQFVARLRQRFPQAKIELLSEGWGGRNTASFLAEPPGSVHNYQEKVLALRPDLVISEFVNDAGLTPEQVETRYGKLLADFTVIGAEWIILTPHYVRPDMMGFTGQRDIDADPRPYVTGLRQFVARHPVVLADASLRWGRLWRQGIPYNTLNVNAINHPDARGMKMFADSLMAVFP
jgi:hypothetical protein